MTATWTTRSRGTVRADELDGGDGDDLIQAGAGNDTVTGGAGDDTFVYLAGDGNDTITDFNSGVSGTISDGNSANNDFIDLSGFYDNLQELYADQADDGVLNQSNAFDGAGNSVDYSDNTQFSGGSLTFTGASGDSSFFTFENTGVMCFVAGTLIETERGPVPVELLAVGDQVVTLNHGLQPIQWIGVTDLTPCALRVAPNLRPVVFSEDALGNAGAMAVSPQHGIAGKHVLSELSGHVVPAKFLVMRPGVAWGDVAEGVRYVHVLLPRHDLILAQGIWSESFYPGPYALRLMAPDARKDFDAAVSSLTSPGGVNHYGPRVLPRATRKFLRDLGLVGHGVNDTLRKIEAKGLDPLGIPR